MRFMPSIKGFKIRIPGKTGNAGVQGGSAAAGEIKSDLVAQIKMPKSTGVIHSFPWENWILPSEKERNKRRKE